jgi:metacaspase-1
MVKGISLHIGLNEVDPKHYDGWKGKLVACEADAKSMQAIAKSAGYETHILLTAAATRESVQSAIREAAARLTSGDIFLISYSGHGGQVPDLNGDEPDDADETWCLYDGEHLDDESFDLWKRFAAGVRVLIFSDSCHSGTVSRARRDELSIEAVAAELRTFGIDEPRFRIMPPETAMATYMANKDFYDAIGTSVPPKEGEPAATVRLISGCQDDQTSADGPFNGLFTSMLLKVWSNGAFKGDYAKFHADIVGRMPKCQRPNHSVIGPAAPAFDGEKPFTIGGQHVAADAKENLARAT